jgi:large subunit ribosomal protein L19
MSNVIDNIERRQERQGLPSFAPGDRVRVHFQVIEGTRRRTQVFEGIVLKRQGSGARETFTVRKQSFGVGVERTFPLHSPKIEKLEIAARGDVRRAKLYYLRGRIGKAARVAERRWGIDDELVSAPVPIEEPQPEEPQDAGPVDAGDPPPPAVADASSGEVPPMSPPAAEAPEGGADGSEAEEASDDKAEEASDEEAPEAEAEAGTDAEAPEAGETEDTAAANNAEDESPQEDSGDSGEDSA